MPAQWFAVPFVRRDIRPGAPGRYCQVDDFTDEIAADSGTWDSFECGGGPDTAYLLGVCFAKVNASAVTLAQIAAGSQVLAIPTKLLELDTSMNVTTNAEKAFIRDQVGRQLGYADAEIAGWLGVAVGASTAQKNQALNTKTYGEFLEFLATRWYTPVYDSRNPPGPQVGFQGISYPGLIAVDGRTVTDGTHPGTSTQRSPTPTSPVQVAANVPSV